MLVLARKSNQTIVIDGKIEIKILKIKGNTVRLGVQAPATVKVLRGELAPFDIEMRPGEVVAEAPVLFDSDDVNRLPNPFSIAHAS